MDVLVLGRFFVERREQTTGLPTADNRLEETSKSVVGGQQSVVDL
jgi:hypothetical protein